VRLGRTTPLRYIPKLSNRMETPTHAATPVALDRLVSRCVTHHFACACREARFRELLEDTIRAHSTPDNGNYNECDKDPCAWCEEAKALIYHGHPDGVLAPKNFAAGGGTDAESRILPRSLPPVAISPTNANVDAQIPAPTKPESITDCDAGICCVSRLVLTLPNYQPTPIK